MTSQVRTILRAATAKANEPLNILSFPTHERYQENLSKTGHNFYLWQGEGIKPWREDYASVPRGTVLLNPQKESRQIPENVDIDLVLSQNKFGQFQIAKQISSQLMVPLLSIEHTLPMDSWPSHYLQQLYEMRGDVNIFISDYSRGEWGWSEDEAQVIHHGIDTDTFSPSDSVERELRVLSVVNDWINRDWCCGFTLWRNTTNYPKSYFPIAVLGDTPGLSEAASSTEELVNEYRRSSIFLNTSTVSPVPTALLEAMSCGCAVVTTGTCMIPEIIKNGENGFMSNNPNELRSYIEKLLSDSNLAKEMGENARETILQNFALNKFVKKWNSFFHSCIEV